MKRMKLLLILLATVLLVILAKMIWVAIMTKDMGSLETELKDILQRRNFLLGRVITEPQRLVDAMPSAIGAHYQGEWAGFSVVRKDSRHYLLADVALVGEAITLAMRTAVPWDI